MFYRRYNYKSPRQLLPRLRNKTVSEQNISNVKHRHRDGICFTEDDNILVYNLYVYNISKNVTEEHLKEYFSRYGEIHSISILSKTRVKSAFRYGFVNFKDAESAARALQTIEHSIQGHRMKIKAADSWKQPTEKVNNKTLFPQEIGRRMMNIDSNGNDKVPPNAILNLNDDCLLHIFSFLTCPEKLKMFGLSKRFENIFKMSLKKTLDINEFSNKITDLRHILIKCGESIEHISCKHLEERWRRFIKYVPQFCPNLKSLKLKYIVKISANMHLLTKLKTINKLELINCNIDDDACFYLLQLPELVSLDLSENDKLTGKYLNKFEKLQTLILRDCIRIKPSNMVEFCKSLKSIKELEIVTTSKEVLDSMVDNMKNLEQLVIKAENWNYIHKVAEIRNLKSLTLLKSYFWDCNLTLLIRKLAIKSRLETFCVLLKFPLDIETLRLIPSIKSIKEITITSDIDNEFLENYAKCNFLQYLHIIFVYGCKNPDAIVNLVKNSKSLQTLHLDFTHFEHDIYEDLILNVIDVIKKEKRSKPLKMIFDGIDERDQASLKDLIPSNLSEIFKLSFKNRRYYDC